MRDLMQLIDPEQRDISKLADKLTDDWESRFNAPKKIRDAGTPNPNYVRPYDSNDLRIVEDHPNRYQQMQDRLEAEEKARNA